MERNGWASSHGNAEDTTAECCTGNWLPIVPLVLSDPTQRSSLSDTTAKELDPTGPDRDYCCDMERDLVVSATQLLHLLDGDSGWGRVESSLRCWFRRSGQGFPGSKGGFAVDKSGIWKGKTREFGFGLDAGAPRTRSGSSHRMFCLRIRVPNGCLLSAKNGCEGHKRLWYASSKAKPAMPVRHWPVLKAMGIRMKELCSSCVVSLAS